MAFAVTIRGQKYDEPGTTTTPYLYKQYVPRKISGCTSI